MSFYLSVTVLHLFVLNACLCSFCDYKKIVDLTWDFDNNTSYWSGVQPFSYTKRVENEERGYWYASGEFCSGEHGGTHIDAPYHFFKYGWKVGDIPAKKTDCKWYVGVLLDLRNETANLEMQHLEEWENINGPFENASVLLIKFGRSKYWNNKTQYFEIDGNNRYNFPGVSKGAAEWLANSGKFFGVGLDTPSVDPGNCKDFIAHRILNGKQMYVLENVKLIEKIPPKGFTLLVMPMKLREGSGAPVRVMAVL
ncbi:hypothetical protein NQ315_001897 [Exocentrus adspersus]|uniref:Cyclase n=1 Tax=Exocentrus adspersus TaxID=1586481 RepID=A0AAV8WA54_9CUCU|nr:hypothetical protein NQ315_001897 [Exocentrus adspersus]